MLKDIGDDHSTDEINILYSVYKSRDNRSMKTVSGKS
jgi:hypothetical protein